MSSTAHAELEAKFLLEQSGGQVETLERFLGEQGFRLVEQPEVRQVDRYFDTECWELYRAGWAFRWRDAGPYTLLGLKSFGSVVGHVHQREEVEQEVDALPESMADFPRGVVADWLRKLLGDAVDQVRELFRLETHRRVVQVRKGETTLLLCIDDSTVIRSSNGLTDRTPALRFQEIELELESADEAVLETLAKAIEKHLAFLPARQSKFERGLQAVGLNPRALPKMTDGSASTPDESVIALVHRRLLTQFEALVNQEGRAWEGLDPEGVHQLRVASRRLRVALDVLLALPDVPSGQARTLREDVRWICGCLGEVRDLDVHQAAIATSVAAGMGAMPEFEGYLDEQRDTGRAVMIDSLGGERYAAFKKGFQAFLKRRFWTKARNRRKALSTRESAKSLLVPALKAFLKQGRKVEKSMTAKSLHALRIQGKHFRYLLEVFEPAFAGKFDVLLTPTKQIQDLLGEHQDACVALKRMESFERANGELTSTGDGLPTLRKSEGKRRKALRKRFSAEWEAYCQEVRPKCLRKALR